MKRFLISGFISLSILLSSCVELVDDITVRSDGSGTFKYTINLSASKIKVNSILSLDSLYGNRMPDLDELKVKVGEFKRKLADQNGISNVTMEIKWDEFIFKLQCDFTNVSALQNALKSVIEELSENKLISENEYNWLNWDGHKFVRSVPDIRLEKSKILKQEEIELLKHGSYTSISRFDRFVEKFDNPEAKLSQNKLNVMVKSNPYLLSQNPNLLENTIYLISSKN
jgi:hypothetical protein